MANATYHQILVVPAAQAVKVAVRKVQRHLAVVATKEAANVVVNAEVAVVVIEEVVTRVAVIVAVVVKIAQVVAVVVKTVVAVIVPADQAEDNI
jgi:hypothetical protein